jgi:hypothetical protein
MRTSRRGSRPRVAQAAATSELTSGIGPHRRRCGLFVRGETQAASVSACATASRAASAPAPFGPPACATLGRDPRRLVRISGGRRVVGDRIGRLAGRRVRHRRIAAGAVALLADHAGRTRRGSDRPVDHLGGSGCESGEGDEAREKYPSHDNPCWLQTQATSSVRHRSRDVATRLKRTPAASGFGSAPQSI